MIMASGELMAMHTFCNSGVCPSKPLMSAPRSWHVPHLGQLLLISTWKPDMSTMTPYLRRGDMQMKGRQPSTARLSDMA